MAQPGEWTTAGSGRVAVVHAAPLLWRGTGRGKPGVVAAAVLADARDASCLLTRQLVPSSSRPRQKPATPAFFFFNLPASHTGLFFFSNLPASPAQQKISPRLGSGRRVVSRVL